MASVADMRRALDSARRKVASIKEKAEETLGEAVATAETAGSGFLASYARGRYGKDGRLLLAGVDADLGVGLGLHALAFMGAFGKYDEHAHNIGNGLVTCYAVHKGYKLGADAKSSSKTSGVPQLKQRQPNMAQSMADKGAFANV